MFEATKKEWCELYAFFRLLADGTVALGTAEAKPGDMNRPVAMILREEHDGPRRYYIEKETVRMEGEKGSVRIPREDFGAVADLILQAVKASASNEVVSPEGVEEFWMRSPYSIWRHEPKTVPIFPFLFGIRRRRCAVSVSARV